MPFHKNRYDPVALLKQLDAGSLERDGVEWCYCFECENEQLGLTDVWAYLPGPEADQQNAVSVLRDFLSHVAQLDNLVQASCEREWRESKLDESNFKLHIANLTPIGESMSVEYYGTSVNTNWIAQFERRSVGEWQAVNIRP